MGILAYFGLKKFDDTVYQLYGRIVAQARLESFYTQQGVADTVNGRFDLITLHIYIVMRRLKDLEKGAGNQLSQDLFDVMFADMDKNMREMGVGDLRVGKKVKALATAFYGRIKAYDEGLAEVDGATLVDSLRRNLYHESTPTDAQVENIAGYVMREIEASKAWSLATISASDFTFGPAPEAGA